MEENNVEEIVTQMKDYSKELNSALASLQKKFGKESAYILSDVKDECPRIPIDSLKLRRVLGGGFPLGRIIEVFGWEQSGKTSLASYFVAQMNRAGKNVLYIDTENAFNPEYAEVIGVNMNMTILAQPESGEEALDLADWAIDNIPNLGMIVLDSIATLTPQAELDGNMGDAHMGLQARLIGQALRKMGNRLKKNNITLLCINQLRMKLGVLYGNPETTTGGKALPYYCSLRLKVNRTEKEDLIDEDGDIVGINIKIKAIKNKIGKPKRACSLKYSFDTGFCTDEEFIDLAVDMGAIKKWGVKYTILETGQKFEGLDAIIEYYNENVSEKRILVRKINSYLDTKMPEDNEDIGSDEHEEG